MSLNMNYCVLIVMDVLNYEIFQDIHAIIREESYQHVLLLFAVVLYIFVDDTGTYIIVIMYNINHIWTLSQSNPNNICFIPIHNHQKYIVII